MKRKRGCFVSAFLLCGFCLFGNGNNIQAAESKLPAVSDLKDLFNLVIDVPTNVSISAIGSWKRYPVFLFSTSKQINAHIDQAIALSKKRGLINTPAQEAEARKQMGESMSRFVTNVGVGKYAEYYYGNRSRMDRLLYEGTNASLEKIIWGTNAGVADINASWINLNTKAVSNAPIIWVNHQTKSAIKAVGNASGHNEPPILHNIVVPDPFVAKLVYVLLAKNNSSQSDMSSDSFSEGKAEQLINGTNSNGTTTGIKVSMESSIADGVTNRVYTFTTGDVVRKVKVPKGVMTSTNHLRIEIETETTADCKFFRRVLADVSIPMSPVYIIKENWEYGSNCIPVKFSESNRKTGGDGYDYNFEHISIGKIDTNEIASLFFDKYPEDYFYEDASSDRRAVVNLPKNLGAVRDVEGVYAPPGIKGTLVRMWKNLSGKKIVILGFLALNFVAMVCLIIRGKVKG